MSAEDHAKARDKIVELVGAAHRDLRHAGVRTQQALADLAGQAGVFAVLDDQTQEGEPFVDRTPCAGHRLWRRNWLVAVRLEASNGRAVEAAARQADVWQAAIIDGLYQRHLYAGALDHVYVPASWSGPGPELGTDRHPVAWISTLAIRVQYFA